MVAADAAAGDGDRWGPQLEVADDLPVAGGPAQCRVVRENRTAYPDDGAAFDDQLVDAVPVKDGDQAGIDALLDTPDERRERTPGPVPQVMWKRGTELPCPPAV